MDDPAPELVWQGRLHLGDGPGVYGDATYVGLGGELPLTLRRFPDAAGPPSATLLVETEGLQPRGGLPGPTIRVVRFGPDGATGRWQERVLGEGRLTGQATTVAVDVSNERPDDGPLPLGLRLRVNAEAPPGLYADFVLVALRLRSVTHYASLGFQAPA